MMNIRKSRRFPRQCAHWLGMTWFFDTLTLRKSGAFQQSDFWIVRDPVLKKPHDLQFVKGIMAGIVTFPVV